ncbi:DUF3891 family protein [Virgibacillus necropolis]|uniref:Uncharacterized protein n=1 Tax=Virgibacillus necropolis TaxID=163877 RepID=A0A221M7F5_9BACI|nr:DUF3891 family protein [Virgibacillus necropolis]ASN03564.1 hypothetical protein CFK40_00255 [Virgibacillus necropolis]
MIVRERTDDIVMITQDNHARISGVFAAKWENSIFNDKDKRASVELAISEHDRGWIPVDKKPFWNDQTGLPYSFMDLPTEPKLVFYKNGIDEIEKMDPYASLLCSHHYYRFTADDFGEESQRFLRNEQDRQNRIKQLIDFDEEAFQFHYDLLNFCDNLSLYVCLNEPDVSKEHEHYFYKKGMPIPSTFSFFYGSHLDICWKDKHTISLSQLPFEEPVVIEINQKVVPKEHIAEEGILSAYENTLEERVRVRVTG